MTSPKSMSDQPGYMDTSYSSPFVQNDVFECEDLACEVSDPVLTNVIVCEIPKNEDTTFKAVRNNDLVMIVRRINEGFDINSAHEEHVGDKIYEIKDWSRMVRQLRLKEYRLLHMAVVHSEIQTIKILLSKGADINAVDVNRISPLALAAAVQRADVVQLLIKHGANLNTQSVSGRTPLIQAICNNNFKIVQQLISAGADLDLADTKGTTPLLACFTIPHSFDERIVHCLVGGGCKVDNQNKLGATPLMTAAGLGRKDIAQLLLQAGADINHRDKAGKSAINLAPGQKTALYLINNGSATDVTDKNGRTPLDNAAHTGHIAMMRLLLGSDCQRSTSILDVPRVEQARNQVPMFNQWLMQELYNPRELKRLCRQEIRSALSPDNTKYICSLPVPQLLKNFLLARQIDLSYT